MPSSHMQAVIREAKGSTLAYDSANPLGIPSTAKAVMPYGDGRFAWSHERFPNARYRYYTVTGDARYGSIVDFEPGLVHDRDSLINFVDARNHLHGDAAVYCDRFDFENYVAGYLEGRSYDLVIATLDGTKLQSFRGKTVKACQFYNDPGQRFDLLEVWDLTWLHAPH